MAKKFWLLSALAAGVLLTGCGQKAVEQRPAAQCKPIAEYETYDTITVGSLDDVPQDCKALLLTVSDIKTDTIAFDYASEEQLYYEFDPTSFASYPTLECFEYIVKIPEEECAQALEEVTQRPLTRLALHCIVMPDLDTLSRMQGLETLWMAGCEFDPVFKGDFSSLTDLWCSWCEVDKLGDIPKIKTLQRLTLRGSGISSIKGIEELSNLSKLDLDNSSVRSLTPLRSMTQLTSLNISDMGSITYRTVPDLTALEGMTNLKTLGLNYCHDGVKHPEALSSLTALEHFSAADSRFSSTEVLEPLVHLRVLDLRANKISDLTPLSGMKELETLMLHNNKLGSIEGVTELPHLKRLAVGANDIIDISPVQELGELEYLSVSQCGNLSDIKPLLRSLSLRELDIGGTNVTDTEILSKLRQLEKLEISGTKISDLSFAEEMKDLRFLDVSSTKTSDITPIMHLTKLEMLDLRNTRVASIEGISRLASLYELRISSTNIQSIDELYKMPSLRKVYVENCRYLSREDVEAYGQKLEERGGKLSTNYH